jgi:hypothetical protein
MKIILLVIIFMLVGCTPNELIRSESGPCELEPLAQKNQWALQESNVRSNMNYSSGILGRIPNLWCYISCSLLNLMIKVFFAIGINLMQ